MADALPPTPGQTIGPFFGFALPYAGDHELVAPGTPGAVRLYGTVLDGAGAPVPDALLEIRQADPDGRVPLVEGALGRNGRGRERAVFTGWGRCATDPGGHFSFTTLEPGATAAGRASHVALAVFARGLLDVLFTRVYLPGPDLDADPFLAGLEPERRTTLLALREDDGSLRFDVHLQGPHETVFLSRPGQA